MNLESYCQRGCWSRFFELQETMASESLTRIDLVRWRQLILADLWNQMPDCASRSSASSVLACAVYASSPQHHRQPSRSWVGSSPYSPHPWKDLWCPSFHGRQDLHLSCLSSREVHSVQNLAVSSTVVTLSAGSVPRVPHGQNRPDRSLCFADLDDLWNQIRVLY